MSLQRSRKAKTDRFLLKTKKPDSDIENDIENDNDNESDSESDKDKCASLFLSRSERTEIFTLISEGGITV